MLPNKEPLQKICKAIATLDAIICQDWEYRYYSYNNKWDAGEECFSMRNGEGDELLILFKENACILNAFLLELKQPELNKAIPNKFYEFIYTEPIKSIGTTFCCWTDERGNWQIKDFGKLDPLIESFIEVYQLDPEFYINWAYDYYELEYLPTELVKQVYQNQKLTQEMVLSINPDLEDWGALKSDLESISYPFEFSK